MTQTYSTVTAGKLLSARSVMKPAFFILHGDKRPPMFFL